MSIHQSLIVLFSFLYGREERIRQEEEEEKRRKLQAAENKARLVEAFLKEKEKEVLQLQVRAAGASWEECCQQGFDGSLWEQRGSCRLIFLRFFCVGSWEHKC